MISDDFHGGGGGEAYSHDWDINDPDIPAKVHHYVRFLVMFLFSPPYPEIFFLLCGFANH